MELVNGIWDYVVPFLFVLTVLVFVHELGHYLVARRNGVRVEVFSIGFGPEIKGWTDRSGTRWRISAIPLGGYVKMFGEYGDAVGEGDAAREMTTDELSVSFHHKRVLQRAAIVAAGPLANFLFTMVVLALLFAVVGSPKSLAGIGDIQAGSAAADAGFRAGDRVLAIGDREVKWFEDLRAVVSVSPGVPLEFRVLRDGSEILLTASPHAQASGDSTIGLLGVRPDPGQIETQRFGPVEAVTMGIGKTFSMAGDILGALGQMITGQRKSEELGGPLMIAKLSGDVAQGGLTNLIFFMAALSLNLGLINLFPIPMLDGGHLVFYGLEALRGRPLGEKAQEYGFRFGLILVLALMVFATWNDLVNLKVVQFIVDLVT